MTADGSVEDWVFKDGATWRVGTQAMVKWIIDGTETGLTITSAIPPIFDAYATVVVPEHDDERHAAEHALVTLLAKEAAPGPWWLGYLDTGGSDVVFPDAPKVGLYAGWGYVLVEAGPEQATMWRTDRPDRGALPDLMFAHGHTWLVSRLWDDDWRCVGGTTRLVDRILAHPDLDANSVDVYADATPRGHTAR